MPTKTYVVRLMIADLADVYSDGLYHGDLMVADTLFGRGERVQDVTGYNVGYQIHTVDSHGNPGNEFYEPDAEEWFVTTNPAFSALHLD